MTAVSNSFLNPNVSSSKTPSDFLSRYSMVLPDAIASLAHANATRQLELSYKPGCYDVVCGRGKGSYNRPGNKHFRALVVTYIGEYQQARTKVDKSTVLNGIVDKVRSYIDPDTSLPAQFVKYTKGEGWVQIGDDLAREKVGHAIREAVTVKAGDASLSNPSFSPISFRVPLSQQRQLSVGSIGSIGSINSRRPSFTPLPAFDSIITSIIGL